MVGKFNVVINEKYSLLFVSYSYVEAMRDLVALYCPTLLHGFPDHNNMYWTVCTLYIIKFGGNICTVQYNVQYNAVRSTRLYCTVL